MNMRIRLSLTVRNDADLLGIRNIEDFEFKDWIKNALRSYAATGQTVKTLLIATSAASELNNVMLSITLHERKDTVIIEWLKKLAKNRCAGAIKIVLRCSLVNPCLFAYYNDPADVLPEIWTEGEKNAAETERFITTGSHVDAHGIVSSHPFSAEALKSEADDEDDDFKFFNMSMEPEPD